MAIHCRGTCFFITRTCQIVMLNNPQDEGHRLKNMNCRLIKELLTYNSANRLLITGTPLQNNISELWSLLHFLLPDVFNDLNSFESWFDFSSVLDTTGQAERVEKRKHNLVTSMHAILKPFLLRRLKTDVEHSLPKKREYILYAPLTAEQKDLYREIINGTGRQYLENKAFERLESKSASSSRSQSMKRKRSDSSDSSPVESARSTKTSTPVGRGAPSKRRRRSTRQTYQDQSDGEFDEHLRKLELGIQEDDEPEPEPSDSELEEHERAKNLKLASMCLCCSRLTLTFANYCHRERNWPEEDAKPGSAGTSCLQLTSQLLLALDGRR